MIPTASQKAFGEFFKARRKVLGYTLRRFCQEKGLDPGNMSRMERGLVSPPQKREKLAEYAGHLELEPESDEWYQFSDLAYASSGRIPEELLNDKELATKPPILFRTLRGQKVTEEQLDELIKKIKDARGGG